MEENVDFENFDLVDEEMGEGDVIIGVVLKN